MQGPLNVKVRSEVITTDIKYFSGNVMLGRKLFYVIRTRDSFSYNVLRFLSMSFSRLPVHGEGHKNTFSFTSPCKSSIVMLAWLRLQLSAEYDFPLPSLAQHSDV